MWKKNFICATALIATTMVTSCGNSTEGSSEKQAQAQTGSEQKDAQKIDTYGTSEVTDTIKLGGKIYTYDMKCEKAADLPVLVDEFDEKYYQNRVSLTLWHKGEQLGTLHFTKENFEANASKQIQEQMKGALLTGFILERSECDGGRLCFLTTIGWAGEGPKFKVYIDTNAKGHSIQYYDQTDSNTYEAPHS